MTQLPTVQDAVYPRYVELLELEPRLTRTQAAERLHVNRNTLDKAIERAESTVHPDRPGDLALLMQMAGEHFQHRGWDDMARRCYRQAGHIKEGAET